jgi:hypothetical protein
VKVGSFSQHGRVPTQSVNAIKPGIADFFRSAQIGKSEQILAGFANPARTIHALT